MKKKLAVLLISLLRATAQDVPSVDLLDAGNWIAQDYARLSTASHEQLRKFVFAALEKLPDQNLKQYLTEQGEGGFLIRNPLFRDLDGDSFLELIVAADVPGRPFFNTVLAVTRKDGQTRIGAAVGWGEEHDFARELVDLRKDGHYELVARDPGEEYPAPSAFDRLTAEEREAMPSFADVHIYQWNGTALEDVGGEFPDFVSTEVIEASRKAAEAVRELDQLSVEDREDLATLYESRAYSAERMLGSPDAGVENRSVGFFNE